MNQKRVVVIGAGTSGLVAAYTLKKKGINAIVLEANERAGGRLGGDRVGDFHLDEAADWFTQSHDVALEVCDELGLPMMVAGQTAGWHRRGKFLVTYHADVKPLTVMRNMKAMAQLGLFSPRSLMALSKITGRITRQRSYLSFASDAHPEEIDTGELFVDYMARIGAPEDLVMVIRRFMENAMGDFEKMSDIQVFAFLAQILTKGHQLRVPEKGIGSIVHALVARIGDSIQFSTPVKQIEINDGQVSGIIVEGDTIEADAVICTTTSTIASQIIPELPVPIRKAMDKISYSVGCRVVIGLNHRPLPPGWTAVLYPEDRTPLILDRSYYLQACVPPGSATLDLMVGTDRARELLALDDDEIKHQLLADARRKAPPGSNLPADDEGIFTRVYRWPEAMAITPPGALKEMSEALRNHGRDIPNLFLAGEYTRMPSINGAMASGRDAAHAVVNYLMRDKSSSQKRGSSPD
ncbi:MAG: NAD(P)/FAD-dependent oxidoreductase [Rhodobacteraceae bacterium]|nr:NAD(P)/FAD-dependent oxidoreductase [Paracoccaceae bacterium]MCY4249338.1 NAD(P)/FAD-dependent oxidoreductase [Paracoccaceae bacterium]